MTAVPAAWAGTDMISTGVHYGGAAAGVVIPAVQVGVLAHHHVAYLFTMQNYIISTNWPNFSAIIFTLP